MATVRVVVVLAGVLTALGCTGVRTARVGLLPNALPLVTLIVADDVDEVRRQCRDVPATGPILGCQKSRLVALPEGSLVRIVMIARYADVLPSALAFEIDAHELCHAIAALQPIADPCHNENGGVALNAK